MKTYNKPEFFVEEFIANVAVAACDREWSGEVDTSWPSQAITCNRQGSTTDYIFASGTSGCQYEPDKLIYIDTGGTYSVSQLKQLGLNINGNGNSVTVPAGGGYVLCWGNGNHYGPATPEIVDIMTSSF